MWYSLGKSAQSNITNRTANEFGLVGSFTGYGENHFWFGSSDNRVYVSNDKGLNYTAHSVGAPAGAFISNLAFSDTLNGFCTASDGAAIDYGVYKTTMEEKTWSLFINAGDPLGKITKVEVLLMSHVQWHGGFRGLQLEASVLHIQLMVVQIGLQ